MYTARQRNVAQGPSKKCGRTRDLPSVEPIATPCLHTHTTHLQILQPVRGTQVTTFIQPTHNTIRRASMRYTIHTMISRGDGTQQQSEHGSGGRWPGDAIRWRFGQRMHHSHSAWKITEISCAFISGWCAIKSQESSLARRAPTEAQYRAFWIERWAPNYSRRNSPHV